MNNAIIQLMKKEDDNNDFNCMLSNWRQFIV